MNRNYVLDGGINLNTPPLTLLKDSYHLPGDLCLSPMASYWRLNIDHRPAYFLKPLTSDSVHARHVWRSLKFLARQGISLQLTWRETIDGDPFIEWNGRQWVLIPWLNGTSAPVYTRYGFPKLLRLLSQIHHLGVDCPHGESFLPIVAFNKRLSDLESADLLQETPIAREYRKLLAYYIETARQSVVLLKTALKDNFQETICHGDPSPRNTLCLGDGRWVLLDWDRLVRAPRWWELSQAVRRFQRNNYWKTWPIWECMDHHVQPVLKPYEKTALWACLLFPQEFWRLGDQYLYEKLKRPEAWFLKRLHEYEKLELRKRLTLLDWARELRFI